jgi:hypothetical protein
LASATAGAGSDAAPAPRVLCIDPYRFARRSVQALGAGTSRLAAEIPPRVEVVCSAPASLSSDRMRARAWLAATQRAAAGHDVLVVAPELTAASAGSWQATLADWCSLPAAAGDGDLPALAIELPVAWLDDAGLLAAGPPWRARPGWSCAAMRRRSARWRRTAGHSRSRQVRARCNMQSTTLPVGRRRPSPPQPRSPPASRRARGHAGL